MDEQTPCQTPRHELVAKALKHYDEVSSQACSWNSLIPEAIKLWGQNIHQAVDESLAADCKEWLKGCTCAPANAPQRCAECTNAFLESLVRRAQELGLPVGENATT